MSRIASCCLLLCGCIPETKDYELIPAITGAQGEVVTADPGAITVRVTMEWVNGESAPETTVTVSPNVAVEDTTTADVMGRVRVDRVTDFDNVLGPGESASVDYEGTQSPPIPEEGGPDPALLCDGREVHLQVQYSTHGSLADAPQVALSNSFVFECR